MSVLYLIMCDGPGVKGEGCNREADWPAPTLQGYRPALHKAGWSRNTKLNKDYCPMCTRRVTQQAQTR